ncbi:D-alanyl-D-alanine carboxypeptidase [Streptomyces oceani]|uniref:D-alanyl-D-alanine carboxypeptidase n=1 Tax=Streptomyces oceani TaxID=1075402 RepID=A0A1E7JVQ8_9ACTN|nr:D-alanyl-D-alanine carboxypeptidase [Streptomyces oceani]
MRDRVRRVNRELAGRTRRAVRLTRQRWRSAPPRQRQTWRLLASSTALGLAVAGTAVAVAGPWDSGQRTAERARAAAGERGSGADHSGDDAAGSAPRVLAELRVEAGTGPGTGGAKNVPAPKPAALADALRPLLDDPALGTVRTASVVDAATGRELFAERAARPTTPASTIKLATAAAVLSARGADHRIETRVVRAGAEAERIVLVGGGDPTLGGEDLEELAEDTADSLTGDGGSDDSPPEVSLGFDTSRYSGPDRHSIGPNPNLAPVSPLMVNEARLDDSRHGPAPRATEPAREAAERFAEELREAGVETTGKLSKTEAGGQPKELAVHRSAPLSALVERMLTHSDNDIAEALARQTALADDRPASFEGAGKAVERRLAKLGLPTEGVRIADGSGLSRDDKVPAALLTRILELATEPERPALRPTLTGLPVAGFSGTLDSRFPDAEGGAGLVRAKTGTLSGVSTLAGSVVSADGRQLLFAFMTTGADDRAGSRAALDELAAELANCGCR